MTSFKEQLKEFAIKNGADLIGFASKERFEGLDPQVNPFSIFPEANTVIIVGRRITRGTLRGIEEGSNFNDYRLFGYNFLDDNYVSLICYDVTRFLEDNGWEATPIFPNPVESTGAGVSVSKGKAAPNVTPDFDYAAVACGLGEIGLSGMFLTKKFGSRQRFQMIITDAKFESDAILDEIICDECGKCATVCPLNAIDLSHTKEVTICGKTMTVAEIDYSICKKFCKNGASNNRLYDAAKPDRFAALCNRTCVGHLEEVKNIENVFENSFRKREPWAYDIYGKQVKVTE